MTNKISQAYNEGQRKANLTSVAKQYGKISKGNEAMEKTYGNEQKKFMSQASQIERPNGFLEKMAFNLGYSFEKIFFF